jgi:hypothetical protein
MLKTILALLIIGSLVAYNIHGMIQHPVLMWIGIIISGFYATVWAVCWAVQHIDSKFTKKA